MDDVKHEIEAGGIHSVPSPELGPADWVSTDLLNYELWNAITEEFSGSCEDASDHDDTDEFLEPEAELMDEAEERNRTLILLADMRPQLAELLSKASES
jgi:hypothetical protein